jgi:superfamily II DNA or RNA helicase
VSRTRPELSGRARILGDVLAFDAPLDVQAVIRTVGAAAAARGLAYYEDGMVSAVAIERDLGGVAVSANVQGTERHPYRVDVRLDTRSGARPAVTGAHGRCTCPVALNCKHVAAVLFAVGRRPPGSRAEEASEGQVRSLWERVLQPDDAGALRPGRGTQPVALLIEQRRSASGAAALTMRPVTRGAKNNWIRTGTSWQELRYSYHRHPREAAALLREIALLNAAGRSLYDVNQATVDLTAFPSPRIWDILGEAAEAGLLLISDVHGTPVVVGGQPVQPAITVAAARDGAWSLRPEFHLAGQAIDVPVTLIGDPPHGLAYVAGTTPTAHDAAPVPVLHLTRLARPLDPTVQQLFRMPEPVPVPATDRDRFARDFLPRLRRQLDVMPADDTVDLPGPATVRLVLSVRRDDLGMVAVAWYWRYVWGSEAIDIPLGLPAHPDVRDIDVEKALAATGLAATLALPSLRRRGPFGDELVPGTTLSNAQALRLQRDVLPALRQVEGIVIDVSDGALDFREAESAPVVAMAGSLTPDKDWLDLTVSVTVDGETVPFIDLFRALAAREPVLILPSGTYVPLDTPELDSLRTLIEESYALADRDAVGPDSLRVGRYESTLWDELEAMGVLDEQALRWSESVRALAHLTEVPRYDVPPGLTAQLRPYQVDGYTWLSFLCEHRLGGVLADDMGLGKTVQALAMILRARGENPDAPPFLVVAPTSVVANWADEAARFAPGLVVAQIEGTRPKRGTELAEACDGADLVVTSYALFRLEYEAYEAMPWSGLLLDEAQQIKNHLSRGYRCARKLPAPFKVAITGTPMENNLMELWAMFSIAAPGLLADPRRFTEHYRTPIEKHQDADRLATLRRRIRPLLLRRTKDQVIADLPPKSEQVLELELLPQHRRAYQRYLHRERRKVLGLLGDMDRNRFQIFRSLTLLRQAALDAALVDDENADVPSTKLDALVELVDQAASEGHRVLVFSQFTRFLNRARERIDAAGIATCYLDGATRRRSAVLREFREGTAPVFLISLKAGGVGLNLTEADYCIITDPWWNPATERQAIDRTHRIGQDKPVMVYRLVAADTIEEKVMALKARKAALFSSIMTDGGVGASGLTADDIRGLLN